MAAIQWLNNIQFDGKCNATKTLGTMTTIRCGLVLAMIRCADHTVYKNEPPMILGEFN